MFSDNITFSYGQIPTANGTVQKYIHKAFETNIKIWVLTLPIPLGVVHPHTHQHYTMATNIFVILTNNFFFIFIEFSGTEH
jgi:hypothetical protein